MAPGDPTLEAFIDHWSKAEASELANAQLFLGGLARVLGLPEPSNTHADGYSFEFPVKLPSGPGTYTDGRIDLYRRGSFVLEAKQFVGPVADATPLELAAGTAGKRRSGPVRGSDAWDDAMWKARGQAERYARSLPAAEPPAPFLVIVDVGHSLEIFADFTQAGRAYQAFPDPRSFRLRLHDLRDAAVRERLRRIWLDPLSLDPAKVSATVTREIAGYLATLAASLEEAGRAPKLVAEFLTRCLFCMFAEDVGLLPKDGFRHLLESLRGAPEGFVPKLRTLFAEMQTGTDFSVILNRKLLRFNGGLFADASVLPLDANQLEILIRAAGQQWKDVEPAIFGTLLERALDPEERHQLGAHYTPRAYVERLVLPTVIEPLRAEWEAVRTAAVTLSHRAANKRALFAEKGRAGSAGLVFGQRAAVRGTEAELAKLKRSAEEDEREARDAIARFHTRLCEVTVLDPACGSGNFLYVTLEHLKRLEGEVLDTAAGLGESLLLDLATHSVDPHQFLGIELNPRAAALAELVLWIGYLQWHFRTRGQTLPAEPVLKKFRNIECRDAVLAWDGEPVPVTWEMAQANPDLPGLPDEVRQALRSRRGDEADGPRPPASTGPEVKPPPPHGGGYGGVITVWDRRSMKTDLVTGRAVPDETKRVPLLTYPNARPAAWPKADYIVGNPPFIGKKRLREGLGEGYAETLRSAYPAVPETADLVVYWWQKAAELVRSGQANRFGLITTNSISQTFGRQVIEAQMIATPPLSLAFAIPDHPWVDSAEGAAVRIAMTVGTLASLDGHLFKVVSERTADDASVEVLLEGKRGRIQSDLTINEAGGVAQELQANDGLSSVGYQLNGTGFTLDHSQAEALKASDSTAFENYVFPLLSARDITQSPRGFVAIDLFGSKPEELRTEHPALYQWVLTHVKPERDSNPRQSRRERWWIYGEALSTFRPAVKQLSRIIVTPLTAKHRTFVFAAPKTIADSTTVIFAFDDAFFLGVLSSRIHVVFALDAGSRLGVGNDPRYNKTICFNPFPFPACDEAAKARIRALGEELDAHRKRVQAQHPGLSLTALYNVLEKLRAGAVPPGGASFLTPKERLIHDQGLVSMLRQLHDELDAAVATAYGWVRAGRAETDLSDAEILTRLVALNVERAAEEAAGQIRWLRPEYQNPKSGAGPRKEQGALALPAEKPAKPAKPAARKPKPKQVAWPKTLAERVRAVETALQAAGQPVTAAGLAKRFTRARAEDFTEILETLVSLGRAHQAGEKFSV